ncbi:MAG: flippase [Lachnospiraceae bacterium]|nr:flippase [Lachnospiraceae bacterium]
MQKSFAKNIAYNVTYKMLNVLFPLISMAIVSRALLPTGVGKVTSAQNIVTYFTFLAPLGLASYGTREVAKVHGKELNKLFSELFVINTISTFLCVATYYLMVLGVPRFAAERDLYVISGIAIVMNFFNVDWFFQGKEEFRYIAVRSILVKALMLVGILFFVHETADYEKYAFIHVMAIGGNYLFNVAYVWKSEVKFTFRDLELKKHFSALAVLLATNVAVELYSLVDVTMLGFTCTDEVVAYYSNAMRLVKVAIFVIAAIGGVTLPRIMKLLSEKRQDEIDRLVSGVVMLMLALALPCCAGMACMADKIVFVLFGEEFAESISVVIILSGLFLFLTFSNFLGTQVLVAYGKESEALIATIIGAVVNISLNVVLIKAYQHNGAAIASVISECIVLAIMHLFARKHYKLQLNARLIISAVIGCLLMAAVVWTVKGIWENLFVSLVVGIFAGVLSYGLFVFAINRHFFKTMFKLFVK